MARRKGGGWLIHFFRNFEHMQLSTDRPYGKIATMRTDGHRNACRPLLNVWVTSKKRDQNILIDLVMHACMCALLSVSSQHSHGSPLPNLIAAKSSRHIIQTRMVKVDPGVADVAVA